MPRRAAPGPAQPPGSSVSCEQQGSRPKPAPTEARGNSWRTGSLLCSCLRFRWCFQTAFQRLRGVPDRETAFQRGLQRRALGAGEVGLALAGGCSAAPEVPRCSAGRPEEETPLAFPRGEIIPGLISSTASCTVPPAPTTSLLTGALVLQRFHRERVQTRFCGKPPGIRTAPAPGWARTPQEGQAAWPPAQAQQTLPPIRFLLGRNQAAALALAQGD